MSIQPFSHASSKQSSNHRFFYPFIKLSIYRAIHYLSNHSITLSVKKSINLATHRLSLQYLSNHPSDQLPIHPSNRLSNYRSCHLSNHHPFVSTSSCQFTHPSIHATSNRSSYLSNQPLSLPSRHLSILQDIYLSMLHPFIRPAFLIAIHRASIQSACLLSVYPQVIRLFSQP